MRRLGHHPRRWLTTAEHQPGRPRGISYAAVGGASFVIGGACAWRYLRRDVLGDVRTVHQDTSSVTVTSPELVLVTLSEDEAGSSQPMRFACPAETFRELQVLLRGDIDEAKGIILATGRARLSSELHEALVPASDRVDRFADWYFRYPTTYKLLVRALSTAGHHLTSLGHGDKLVDAVQRDLEGYLCGQFLKIVLQPELLDALCCAAFQKAVDESRLQFRELVGNAIRQRVQLVRDSSEAVRFDAPTVHSSVQLDWQSQSFKARGVAALYEKSPEVSVAMVLGGAIAGKATAGAAGMAAAKAAAGKASAALGSKAITALGSKLASPIAVKAAGLMAPGAAGLAGLLAGPAGAVAGAAIGIAADALLSAGTALMQREGFTRDSREALHAIEAEWELVLAKELEAAVHNWCNEAMQLVDGWTSTTDKA